VDLCGFFFEPPESIIPRKAVTGSNKKVGIIVTILGSGGPGHSKKNDIQKISFKIKRIGSMGNKISRDGPQADSWTPIGNF
jgi:hypothetical protein